VRRKQTNIPSQETGFDDQHVTVHRGVGGALCLGGSFK
jgi:hypothetical protein